ncbi:MAG TPA: glycoside hydrolase family 88 protein [Pyrinomonadaceae bacterium]
MSLKAKFIVALIIFSACAGAARGQSAAPLSQRMATTVMTLWPEAVKSDPSRPDRWTYEQGVALTGVEAVWLNTGEGRYFEYIKRVVDKFVADDGTIRTYKKDEYNIDNVQSGRLLLLLYKVTGQEKYAKAAAHLRDQLRTHPRTSEGGFWHKQVYPSQMWLDGLYMGEPFYAEYAATFNEPEAFDDVAKQFILMETHARDAKTGLLYHGWDESKQQRWADKTTGRSPNFWGRAMGWYAMALVDTLEHFPADHPKRAELLAILGRLAAAVEKYQEPKSGLWYQVLDKGGEKGNYLESSAAAMFVYSLAKAVRLGYLPESYLKVAQKGWAGMRQQFVEDAPGGGVNFKGTVSVAGLGGNPYRDGSYAYYLSEKAVTNDAKGAGAFLMAAAEMEAAEGRPVGRGKTVVLDYYFNNEWKKDAAGRPYTWHYKWEEMANGGFSLFGHVFSNLGARTDALRAAPTAQGLKGADVYIIVDPDTEKETEKPNFVEPAHVKAVADWVKSGGVLVLMGNDVGNAEFDHFNTLAKEFGIQFNKDSKNRVQKDNFVEGLVKVPAGHSIFKTARSLYLKELSTLALSKPAAPVLEHNGDVVMAVAKHGRGTVFAVGDPWLYNEYTDGRKLPPEFDNYKAMKDLAAWVLGQSR